MDFQKDIHIPIWGLLLCVLMMLVKTYTTAKGGCRCGRMDGFSAGCGCGKQENFDSLALRYSDPSSRDTEQFLGSLENPIYNDSYESGSKKPKPIKKKSIMINDDSDDSDDEDSFSSGMTLDEKLLNM